jgi:hypothetical protein
MGKARPFHSLFIAHLYLDPQFLLRGRLAKSKPLTLQEGDYAHAVQELNKKIQASPENEDVYKAISSDSPDTIQLAKSLLEIGMKEPILVSDDGYIISGHRRRVANLRAGLQKVPVKVMPFRRDQNHAEFMSRTKTPWRRLGVMLRRLLYKNTEPCRCSIFRPPPAPDVHKAHL